MASFEPSGTRLVLGYDQGEGMGMAKPTHAKVLRTYLVLDRERASAVLAEVAAYAESVGWIVVQRNPEAYQGSRELEAGIGRIFITLHDADLSQAFGDPLEVTIRLDYDRSVGSD